VQLARLEERAELLGRLGLEVDAHSVRPRGVAKDAVPHDAGTPARLGASVERCLPARIVLDVERRERRGVHARAQGLTLLRDDDRVFDLGDPCCLQSRRELGREEETFQPASIRREEIRDDEARVLGAANDAVTEDADLLAEVGGGVEPGPPGVEVVDLAGADGGDRGGAARQCSSRCLLSLP
jgi:hypothetical protein